MGEDTRSYAFLFFIGLFSTILIRFLFFKARTRMPPSPLALPIIGHFHLLGLRPHQSLHNLSKRLGPLIHLRLGSVPHLIASSADVAREFLKTQEQFFSDRPITRSADYITYGSKSFILAPHGPYWKFMKKLCMSELLGLSAIERFLPYRCEEILRVLQVFQKKSETGESVDVSHELRSLANNVICRMAMSRRCSGSEEEAKETREVVEEIVEVLGRFNLADYFGFLKNLDLQGLDKRMADVLQRYDYMMEGIMKEKEESRRSKMETMDDGDEEDGVKDLLDLLLDIYEDESAEMTLTREHIKSFVQELFVAGTDTSALTTEWAIAELINHPSVLEKAREEIDAVTGNTRLVQESDIPNLPYLQAVIKETLRLHPTVPLVFRKSTESCKIKGYDIPAKTVVLLNVWAIGRDQTYWSDPLEFKPDRFMVEKGNMISARGQNFHFLPFGSGRRTCPGASLALRVIHSIVAAMIQCFELKVENGGVDMTEGISLTLPRAHPLVCLPVARLNPLPFTDS